MDGGHAGAWSDLPADVLITILETLDIGDLVRAGAVCQWWNTSSSYVRGLPHLLSRPRTPCLLYTTAAAADDPNVATLYSLTDHRSYTVKLPGPHVHRRWLGASHGWLATADDNAALHLVNPVTGQQISNLPPVTTVEPVRRLLDDGGAVVPGMYVVYPYDWTLRVEPLYLYLRVFLSSDPSSDVGGGGGGGCVVVLLHRSRPDGQISFARLGDPHWTWIRTPTGNELYVDVGFSADDGRMLYGIRRDSAIHEFDLGGEPALERTTILPAQDGTMRHTNYLVDAPWLGDGGCWLMVCRRMGAANLQAYAAWLADRSLPYDGVWNTHSIKMYRVDPAAGTTAAEINDLGGRHALFLGCNSSFGLAVVVRSITRTTRSSTRSTRQSARGTSAFTAWEMGAFIGSSLLRRGWIGRCPLGLYPALAAYSNRLE
uniref:F-box domain-containing protein n=1 Tax=Oryza meridionalis TaxID=40149 RepID=A0A0E0E4R3_9ORYZ